jgi:hypothetical protein
MFQLGYEQRGTSSVGLLAVDTLANVLHATMLSEDTLKFPSYLMIYIAGSIKLTTELISNTNNPAIKVDDRKIVGLVQGSGSEVIINFEDDLSVIEGFLVHRLLVKPNTRLVESLKLEHGNLGEIKVNARFLETSLSGVLQLVIVQLLYASSQVQS